MAKATVVGLDGKNAGTVELPPVFSTPHRADLILRAVLAMQSNARQRYGHDPEAGMRTSARYFGSRHVAPDKMMMNKEMARLPRQWGDTPSHLYMRARLVSGVVGGRSSHAAVPERIFAQKINARERKLAIRSAIAATAVRSLVEERNHKFAGPLPIVVDDAIQSVKKTTDLVEILGKIGLASELKRTAVRKIRAGRGKMRGRRYVKKTGPLIVVTKGEGLVKAARGVAGVDVVRVNGLNAELLSPGAHGARLTLWTKGAIEELKKLK